MAFNPRRQVFDGQYNTFKNLPAGALSGLALPGTSTVASGTPIVLTVDSTQVQTITGTAAQIVKLPITNVKAGYQCTIICQTTGGVTVQAANGTTIAVLPVGFMGIFRAWIDGAANNTHWTGDLRANGTALMAYNNTLQIISNGTATLYQLPATGTPAAATLAMWDAQGNLSANAFLASSNSTASSATPIVMTIASAQVQIITGTTTAQTIKLPTTAIGAGQERVVVNQMTVASVTVQASGGTTVAILGPNQAGVFRAKVATPTTNTQWAQQLPVDQLDARYVAPASLDGIFIPSDYGWIAWSGDPYKAYSSATPVSAGYANFTLLPIRQATTITNIIMDVQTAGSGLTSGQNLAGLFDRNGSLLSPTADQSTNWQSAALKTMALTTPQAVSPGLYYVGYLWNGTTGPKFSFDVAASAANGANSGIPVPRFAIDSAHTGLTTAFPATATLTAENAAYWAAVS